MGMEALTSRKTRNYKKKRKSIIDRENIRFKKIFFVGVCEVFSYCRVI